MVDETGAPWPYDPPKPADAQPPLVPSWECPEGICVCHEQEGHRVPFAHTITFFDEWAVRMPGARCRVFRNGVLLNVAEPYANEAAAVTVQLRAHTVWLELEWAPAACPKDDRYPFRKRYHVVVTRGLEARVQRRLSNIGYVLHRSLRTNLLDFQEEYGLPRTGKPTDAEPYLIGYHDGAALPPRRHRVPVQSEGGITMVARGVAGPQPDATPGSARGLVTAQAPAVAAPPPPPPPPGAEAVTAMLPHGAAAPTAAPAPVQSFDPFLRATPPVYSDRDPRLAVALRDHPVRFPNVALSVTDLSFHFRPYYGYLDTGVYFSASTCKATALVTACLLLNSLRWFANAAFLDGLPIPRDQFLDEAAKRFRQPILDVARAHPKLNESIDAELLPNLERGFTVEDPARPPSWPADRAPWVAGPYRVEFSKPMHDPSPRYLNSSIDWMMMLSVNAAAANVIQTTGYGYIHGALKYAGLFDVAQNKGLWLAGDYKETTVGKYKYHRIPCDNDRDTAQGATTRTFVQLIDMAIHGKLGDSQFMAGQLAMSRTNHPSWLLRDGPRARERHGFFDEMGKIGDGPVLGGGMVYSEVLVIRHLMTNRQFLLSYQNAKSGQLAPLGDFLLRALNQYVVETQIVF